MAKTVNQYFESEIKRHLDDARAITRKAEDENRALSPDERSAVEGHITEVNVMKAKTAEMDDNQRLLDAIAGAAGPTEGPTGLNAKPARSLGEAFVKSDGYRGLKARGMGGSNWTTGAVQFGTKAGGLDVEDGEGIDVVSEGTTSNFASGSTNVHPQVLPGVQAPVTQKLQVADLLGQGTTGSNTIVYLKETVTAVVNPAITGVPGTYDAVLTAEGALKPAAELDFEKVTASVDKIATFLPISDEMLEDEPQVASYINGRLIFFIKQAEEAYLVEAIQDVYGTSSSSSEIGTAGNLFDAIAAAMYHVRLEAGLEPDAVLCSPLDAAKMDVAKASTSGNYFSGGPYASPDQNPWGLRRVVTTSAAVGGMIVGAFRDGATVWRRGGLSIEASNSHSDYFRRNLTALRCEERLALTIFRDAAFQKCSTS